LFEEFSNVFRISAKILRTASPLVPVRFEKQQPAVVFHRFIPTFPIQIIKCAFDFTLPALPFGDHSGYHSKVFSRKFSALKETLTFATGPLPYRKS
jgi:hypothetical protein